MIDDVRQHSLHRFPEQPLGALESLELESRRNSCAQLDEVAIVEWAPPLQAEGPQQCEPTEIVAGRRLVVVVQMRREIVVRTVVAVVRVDHGTKRVAVTRSEERRVGKECRS